MTLYIAVSFGRPDREIEPFVFTCIDYATFDRSSLDDVLEFLSKEHDIQRSTTDEILVFENDHLTSHWTFEDGLGIEREDPSTLDGY